ncbi:3-methyl-2-oxobutanoate dehydrogenase subunit VorB [Methanohalophilus portucalensis]|uniref:3-methyl-2-oxobutanoate dehydrogenase subunit VorB n=2 Tax=Methanohalophilus portucalensis TaxID=39664 RepID=A0A1L9C2J4_9EURY|nr:3-methyl-2-oxobutanoate dehydrogenase subunit VorB [Methanohalophilus portucalensis]ATU08144.1 3-methyl-2-oxobutanoate dehydrogenase subunit VorB [Methanohalophilus portucalensis]OJH48707.1 ketoisovalerate ferredoxin oxidoreductase, alpha subunit [Methanohalophilus portucalensis FDF-1]RNI10123.1 3-methyl-2-oxobutanoate dehydrogenase subunit VorB [Methanohalophilus portucalensis FDF-1]SMH43913.1 ketoisovalerate ferredoxin oxidoreductase, alpha subunit [Methanohalophilus portucalensis FDF-1]
MATQLTKGNDAVIIGALYGGCDCYFGYPITPASEILHEASRTFPQVGRKFVQAESEEAAISMVFGAASAGHRVMTASSGPGISLKQEGVSYLAGAQLPCVIVDIMRAGPGLGNIGPEQGDYNQVVKGGGHGNYRNIVVAPNSVQEMCDLTIKAFELSTKYRNPVVVLADGVLGQMVEPLKFPEKAVKPAIDNSWAVRGNKETYQNLVTSIFLDFGELEEFNYELQEKYETIKEREVDVDEYMMDDAEIVLVSYGISSRICRSAVELARKEDIKAGLFRPITLFPFPEKELAELAGKGVNFISVEMSNGQLRDDIKLATCCKKPVELVNRMGGNLITMDQVLGKIREVAGKEE